MNILLPILTKHLRHGGVTQFVINFLESLPSNVSAHDLQSSIKPALCVSVVNRFDDFIRGLIYLVNFLFFSFKLNGVDHVFLNPSMGKKSISRSIYFASRCVVKSVPFTIFIHGWDWNYVKYLDVRHNDRKIIVNLLNRAVTVYVLCNDFKEKLVSWGISSNRLQLEYTTVANEFIPDFSLIRSFGKGRKILFLARVVREKGIFIALEAFKLHLQTSPDSIFIVAGVGPDLDEAKIHVQENKISNVQFHGYVDGLLKKKLLSEADIFLFPTFYPEGMPICIFEAMAYGQFIVTRPVGGVADYFTSSMGVALESKEPAVFAEVLNSIVSDVDRLTKVAYFNHDFVSKNCRSILIAERILSRMEG